MLSVGTVEKKKIQDVDGYDKMIHSFDSLSYLKLSSSNFIKLACQDYDNRVVSVQQEYKKLENGVMMTFQDTIYSIKIHEVTLRELLILESFYVTRTALDIYELIRT